MALIVIDDPGRIGAVADIVAEKDEAVDLEQARMGKAGRERLAVAVDVGEDGDEHGGSTTPKPPPPQLADGRQEAKA